MRDYRRQKRSAALRVYAAAVAKETDFHRVQRLSDQLIQQFGGTHKLAKALVREIKAASGTGLGRARAIKGLLAVMNLAALCELNQPPSPLTELSDEELREVLQHKLQQLLHEAPPGDERG
jgi:DNA repair protein RadC